MLFVLCIWPCSYSQQDNFVFCPFFIVLFLFSIHPFKHCAPLAGKRELVCALFTVRLGFLALPLCVIGGLRSAMVALPLMSLVGYVLRW